MTYTNVVNKGLGDRVRKLRETKGYTQNEVAVMVGISQPSYQRIEAGQINSPRFLKKLAAALGSNEKYILFGDDNPAFICAERPPPAYNVHNKIDIDFDFTLIGSKIDYCPHSLKLGKDCVLFFKETIIPDTYQIYDLEIHGSNTRTMRKTRTDGLDVYLIPDGLGKEYCLSDYTYKFVGSLVALKIL